MDVIDAKYEAKDVSLYRWSHNPLVDDDNLPQIFQELDSRSVDDLLVPALDDPIEVKEEYVSKFTLSCFDTPENAEKLYHRLTEKRSAERIKKFEEQKGNYIVKVDIKKDNALKDATRDNGHTQILLREGVRIDDLIDNDFRPIKIELK
jgi:hypothetical protein